MNKWHVYSDLDDKKIKVGNGAYCDNPIKYNHSGVIAYDNPSYIPKYAKKLVERAYKLQGGNV